MRCNASSLCHFILLHRTSVKLINMFFQINIALGSNPTPYCRVALNIDPSFDFPYHLDIAPIGFLIKMRSDE